MSGALKCKLSWTWVWIYADQPRRCPLCNRWSSPSGEVWLEIMEVFCYTDGRPQERQDMCICSICVPEFYPVALHTPHLLD